MYLNIDEVVRETAASGTTFGERVKVLFQENVYRIGTGLKFCRRFSGDSSNSADSGSSGGYCDSWHKEGKENKEKTGYWKTGQGGGKKET